MLVPALNYAERDRLEGRLSAEEEAAVVETTRDLLDTLRDRTTTNVPPSEARLRILGCSARGASDELALRMLDQLVADVPIAMEITTTRLLTSELVDRVKAGDYGALCVADLPPSPPSKTRYLVKKIRAACPDLRIAVGRWAVQELADDNAQMLLDAGASHVASTLLETQRYLAELAHVGAPMPARPDAA